jgi:hypothetical protein
MGVVAPRQPPELLEALGATLLEQAAAEDIDTSRWLGEENTPEIFAQVVTHIGDAILRGSVAVRVIEACAQLGLEPGAAAAIALAGREALAGADPNVRQILAHVVLQQVVAQRLNVSATLGEKLTQDRLVPLQDELVDELLGPELVQQALGGPASTEGLAG